MGPYLMSVYLIGVYPHERASHVRVPHGHLSYGRVLRLRVFLARRTRVARVPISTLRMFLRLLIVGDSAARLLVTPWSALRVVKSRRKDCPTAEVLPRPKQQLCIQNGTRAHYLNYLQKRGRGGEKKRRQSNWLANQMDRNVMDRQVIDRQVEDRRTGRNKTDKRWYPSRLCSVLNSGL
jgi:hypothetical protein